MWAIGFARTSADGVHRRGFPWNDLEVFAAANLIRSAFTGWCPMMALLRKLGVQE
ncbi:MAG: DUF2892 domain-containing protein [Nitrospira sp.]|nr:MAG: DUF2892 domain-containing protein [Nitrospira sp.]